MITNDDLTTRAIEWALRGLDRRADVIADNIANAEVPNFRASRVEFETQLRAALDRGQITRMPEPTLRTTTDPADLKGNNVRLEDELVGLIETNLRRQAMVEAFNYKVGLYRLAIGGRR